MQGSQVVVFEVLAPPGAPLRRSYSAGIVGERVEDELDARRGDRLGQVLGKAASSAAGHDDP